jgi:hypothetical protein
MHVGLPSKHTDHNRDVSPLPHRAYSALLSSFDADSVDMDKFREGGGGCELVDKTSGLNGSPRGFCPVLGKLKPCAALFVILNKENAHGN